MKTLSTLALALASAVAGAPPTAAQSCIGIACQGLSKHELFVERQYRDFVLPRYPGYGSRYEGRRPDISVGPGATVGGPLPGTAGTRMRPRREIPLDLNAHLRWCLERYASYRLDDNTYQPFNGRRRLCNSPYD